MTPRDQSTFTGDHVTTAKHAEISCYGKSYLVDDKHFDPLQMLVELND